MTRWFILWTRQVIEKFAEKQEQDADHTDDDADGDGDEGNEGASLLPPECTNAPAYQLLSVFKT